MDNKRLVIVIVVSMAMVFVWTLVANKVREAHPEWFPAAEQPVASTQPSGPTTDTAGAVVAPTTVVASTQPATSLRVLVDGAAAKPHTMGHGLYDRVGKASELKLALSVSQRGAGVDWVVLNRFTKAVGSDAPYIFQQPYELGDVSLRRALATRKIIVNGVSEEVGGVDWTCIEALPESVVYGLRIADSAGKAVLDVTKEYRIQARSDKSEGYEVLLAYKFRNPTSEAVKVKTVFNGPNVPPVENSRDLPEVVVGYNDEFEVKLGHHPGTDLSPDKEAMDLADPKGLPLLWAGVTSAYFNAIVRPEVARDGKTPSLAGVKAQALEKRDAATGQEYIALTFETAELTVPASGEMSVPFHVYFGPRQRAVLNNPYYSVFPQSYDKTLVLTSGVCAKCTFQWLINVLVWMLTGFHFILRDWGLAIIALVLVVRLLLHPITKKSQISMSKMSKMGPEMERLKKKYGDNKEELNKAMMAFYKEQGITPILGCLPMFLQMPIWIALWSSLQSTFELRHAPFLWGLTWIKDLAQPDWLWHFPKSPINLFFTSVDAVNLLPILMGVVFYLQQKMTPKPAAMTPEQAQQQKMMQWMSLLFPLLLYSGPSGLNLYILTSTAIGIWESKRVRDHIEAQEAAEKEGKVIVDAKASRASRRHAKEERGEEGGKKRGRLMGWIERLQKKADEVRAAAERRDKGKK